MRDIVAVVSDDEPGLLVDARFHAFSDPASTFLRLGKPSSRDRRGDGLAEWIYRADGFFLLVDERRDALHTATFQWKQRSDGPSAQIVTDMGFGAHSSPDELLQLHGDPDYSRVERFGSLEPQIVYEKTLFVMSMNDFVHFRVTFSEGCASTLQLTVKSILDT